MDIHYQTLLSAVPKRFSRWTVETLPDDTEHLSLWQRYCDGDILTRVATGKGIYAFGTVGNGKTSVTTAIANTYIVRQALADIRQGTPSRQLVAYVNVPDLLEAIRKGFSDDKARVAIEAKLTALVNVPLALLDDIGAERPNEWVRERLLEILGARYDNERCTFFTSNLTLDELKVALGARLASRIEGMCAPVRFVSADRRRKI